MSDLDLEGWHNIILCHVLVSMLGKSKLDAFKKFFRLTKDEADIIDRMFGSSRTINSGKNGDGYGEK